MNMISIPKRQVAFRDIVKKIEPYIDDPQFDPSTVKKASKAAFGLCSWVRAMYSYDAIANIIRPKREALAIAQAEYDVVHKVLRLHLHCVIKVNPNAII